MLQSVSYVILVLRRYHSPFSGNQTVGVEKSRVGYRGFSRVIRRRSSQSAHAPWHSGYGSCPISQTATMETMPLTLGAIRLSSYLHYMLSVAQRTDTRCCGFAGEVLLCASADGNAIRRDTDLSTPSSRKSCQYDKKPLTVDAGRTLAEADPPVRGVCEEKG